MNATTIQEQNIAVGDWARLDKVLRDAGLSEPELRELEVAVKDDGQKMGSGVMGWIKKAASKVAVGGVKVTTAIAQPLLIEWLKQYFGLKQ